ncbi:Carbonic anhydrase [Planctomycetes bacterium CA13]|uniref:Carbonic anhydrase n=1 Tax=Novipirellula herctigrandis TaxID=2527986 RepID=A0A5C5YY81_9BACT|nr:Carbonic anhydrase [Planctomycetes bacterium CA13]
MNNQVDKDASASSKKSSSRHVIIFGITLFSICVSPGFCAHAIEPSSIEGPAPELVSSSVSASEALDLLIDGNERFAVEKPMHGHESCSRRNSLLKGQHPFAVIVGCADSRVPPELIFDQGFGDLFVIRNAGNLIATDVAASIEYAVTHLDTQLVVVMGHEGCGAITAALASSEARSHEPMELQAVLKMIEVSLSDHEHPADPTQYVAAAVKANVISAVKQLRFMAIEHGDPALKKAKIVGAIYNMHSGKVEFME